MTGRIIRCATSMSGPSRASCRIRRSGSRARSSLETMEGVAKRGYDYFLSSRTHGAGTRLAAQRFAGIIKQHGGTYHPFRMGILLSVYVAETDEQAREEAHEGVWYFLKNCLKGHLRREGRPLTSARACPRPRCAPTRISSRTRRSAASSSAMPKAGRSSTPAARSSPAAPRPCARGCGR